MAKRASLARLVDSRLRKAGLKPDDPGLVAIREWNAVAYGRGEERR